MPINTQYTALLLELEQIDKQQKHQKEKGHDDDPQDTRHRPVQFGGQGAKILLEDGAQAA